MTPNPTQTQSNGKTGERMGGPGKVQNEDYSD